MGRILAYLSLLLLGGCVLPPAWTFWHWTVEGTSYSTTRKSATDHAISYIRDEDCALWRATETGKICREHIPDYKGRPALKPQNVASVPAGMSAERYVSLLHRLRPYHLNLPDQSEPESEIDESATAFAGTGGQPIDPNAQPPVPAVPATPVERQAVAPTRRAAAIESGDPIDLLEATSPEAGAPIEWKPLETTPLDRGDLERRLADAERRLADAERRLRGPTVENADDTSADRTEGPLPTNEIVPVPVDGGDISAIPRPPSFVDVSDNREIAPAASEQVVDSHSIPSYPANDTTALPKVTELASVPYYQPTSTHLANDAVGQTEINVLADVADEVPTSIDLATDTVAQPDLTGVAGLRDDDPRSMLTSVDKAPASVARLEPISPRTVRPQHKPESPIPHMAVMVEIEPAADAPAMADILRPSATLILEKTSKPGPTGDGWLSANNVSIDRQRRKMTVAGNVVVAQDELMLIADRVTYDRSTGVVRAHGNVSLIGPDGETMTTEKLVVDGPLRRRVIERFQVTS